MPVRSPQTARGTKVIVSRQFRHTGFFFNALSRLAWMARSLSGNPCENVRSENSASILRIDSTASRAFRSWQGHEFTRYSREFLIDGVMNTVIDKVQRREARMLIDMLERFARGENGNYDSQTPAVSVYFR